MYSGVYFPPGLPAIVLDYLDGDVLSYDEKPIPAKSRQDLMLFGRKYHELISTDASIVAELILKGEENDVEEALKLVRQNPSLLHRQAKAKDPLGRWIQGTLLQIAAMAGDVDLKAGIIEEKEHGLVERLKLAGKLSAEEVAEQLKVITSDEAKQANEKRNQRVLDVIKKFGEGIIKKAEEFKSDRSFKEFQIQCQSIIDQLESDLTAGMKEVIISGYIFDPSILQKAAEWFNDNQHRFSSFWSNRGDVFWINGFGKLQSKLSSRDAQIILKGAGNFIDDGEMPNRTLNNADGTSDFFNLTSRLGVDFYLRGCGLRAVGDTIWCGGFPSLQNLCQAKTRALQNVCNTQTIGLHRAHA